MKKKYWEKARGNSVATLTKAQLVQINYIVNKINFNKVNIKVAWILTSNRITIFDVFMPIGVGLME